MITLSTEQEAAIRGVDDWLAAQAFQKGFRVLTGPAGTGKCLGIGTSVLLHDGTVKCVEDIAVGDLLMGPDSKPRRVLGLGRGRAPMYRVAPTKGDAWTCNVDHIMTLAGTNHHLGKVRDMSVRELLGHHKPDRNWKLWRVGVDFPTAAQPVDPYLVGLWLGDGTTTCTNITSADSEIIEYCRAIAPRYGLTCTVVREKSRASRVRLCGPRGKAGGNPLRTVTRDCLDAAGSKFIPNNYLVADRAQRLALLAGLIDTDGSLMRDGGYDISMKSAPLRDGILYLARSLGLAAYSHVSEKGIKSTGFRGSYHRISISGNIDEVPCLLPRKRASKRSQIKRTSVTGFELQPIGEGDYYGFTLDGDGRFLLGDFTVTHNTTLAKKLAENRRVLFCAYTGKAAAVLREKGCAGATTLHRAIYRAQERAVEDSEGNRVFTSDFVARDDGPLEGFDLVVLDECSMASTQMAVDLLSYGVPVLAMGDPFQLPPIAGEGYFATREPDFRLTEVHRQALESGILRLATDIREGRGVGDPASYGPEAVVCSLDEAGQMEDELLGWCDVVLVGTHRMRHHFNNRYREAAKRRGPYPERGEQLVCLQNDHRRGLLNGELWQVEHDAREAGHLKLEVLVRPVGGGEPLLAETWAHDFIGQEEQLQALPHRSRVARARFAYGYALTVHKSQGSEYDRVVVIDESRTFREHSERWLYTAATRAAKNLVLVRP